MDEFVAEVDEAIRDGKVPSSQPDTTISKTTLENAAPFLTHLETQKEILCHVRNR